MLKQFGFMVAAIAVAVPSVVCAQQPGASPGPKDPAAQIGDRLITVSEVDEAWRRSDPTGLMRATQSLYDGRRQALDAMIANMLIEQAAKARGLSAEQYLREEMARRVTPVTDAQIGSFFEQNRAQMPGRPLHEVSSRIRTYLEEQHRTQAREALVAELRTTAPAIRVALEPPRQHVDIASSDPSRGPANAPVVLVEFSDYQ